MGLGGRFLMGAIFIFGLAVFSQTADFSSDESAAGKQNAETFLLADEEDPENSGMTLVAKDGITGPLGPTIWEKVSRRYRAKLQFLMP